MWSVRKSLLISARLLILLLLLYRFYMPTGEHFYSSGVWACSAKTKTPSTFPPPSYTVVWCHPSFISISFRYFTLSPPLLLYGLKFYFIFTTFHHKLSSIWQELIIKVKSLVCVWHDWPGLEWAECQTDRGQHNTAVDKTDERKYCYFLPFTLSQHLMVLNLCFCEISYHNRKYWLNYQFNHVQIKEYILGKQGNHKYT